MTRSFAAAGRASRAEGQGVGEDGARHGVLRWIWAEVCRERAGSAIGGKLPKDGGGAVVDGWSNGASIIR